MRLTGRRVLVGIGLIAFVGLVAIGATLILPALNPRVSQSEATAVALRQASQMDPGVHGFVVVSAHYDAAPDRVVDGRGNVIYSETHSSCPVLIFRVRRGSATLRVSGSCFSEPRRRVALPIMRATSW
jgi:hypothetical protein